MTNDTLSSDFITELPAEQGAYTEIKKMHTSSSGFNELWELRRLGKLHVLKNLQPLYQHNPLYEKLLQKEFDISYKLEHMHICRTLGWENHQTLGNCILMEYIDGETLKNFMQSGKLTLALAHKFINEICDALQYIHSKQVIHRDLKPGNILITYNGHNIKLIDFGLSDCDDYHTLKIPAGTRHYIAPEQMQEGVNLDIRADIYSLGVVIAEMGDLLNNRHLKAIAKKAMQPDRNRRYASALEIKQALNKKTMPRSIVIALPVALLAVVSLFVFTDKETNHQDMNARSSMSELVYSNSTVTNLYQQTLLSESARLQHHIKHSSPGEEQVKADSLQLVRKLQEVCDVNFPLDKQKQSVRYQKLQQELHRAVAKEISKLRNSY